MLPASEGVPPAASIHFAVERQQCASKIEVVEYQERGSERRARDA
jgi:hypothetical protein